MSVDLVKAFLSPIHEKEKVIFKPQKVCVKHGNLNNDSTCKCELLRTIAARNRNVAIARNASGGSPLNRHEKPEKETIYEVERLIDVYMHGKSKTKVKQAIPEAIYKKQTKPTLKVNHPIVTED